MLKKLIILLLILSSSITYSESLHRTVFYTKFKWTAKHGLTSWKITPYIYEEFRYNFEVDYVDRYRTAIGVTSKLLQRTTFDVRLYNDQRRRYNDWDSYNECEFGITFSF